ncbi:hypothetical protein EJ03DRAFT_7470 [Teratosphaeria nubilosa]|uniref:Uncharacterized protein n=1 Tax=Teratosphaeria nubilosa TaxID=161662 RepID=A0A6G1LPF5_9PEZI|nr:hypothetical protein EJ03DRAFT_7470 [Teratosphaeria nubilosa]
MLVVWIFAFLWRGPRYGLDYLIRDCPKILITISSRTLCTFFLFGAALSQSTLNLASSCSRAACLYALGLFSKN